MAFLAQVESAELTNPFYSGFVVFDLFPILVLVKAKASHLSPSPEDSSLIGVRSANLVIASQEFGISRRAGVRNFGLPSVGGRASRPISGNPCARPTGIVLRSVWRGGKAGDHHRDGTDAPICRAAS